MRGMRVLPFVRTGAALAALALSAGMAAAAEPLTVVELFTSQGCSSCPPANANLIKLSGQGAILALSFDVTYWDYLGWKDSFGDEAFTRRQETYEPGLGQRGPFTPQIVVNGAGDTVGNDFSELQALIGKHGKVTGPSVDIRAGTVQIGAGKGGTADVWLVRYRPGTVAVDVKRGENQGHTLKQANVVRELTRLGAWDGKALSLPVRPGANDLKTAVLVQKTGGGKILAAAVE